MNSLPSKHRIALSLYLSSPESTLPVITEVQPWEKAKLVATVNSGPFETL